MKVWGKPPSLPLLAAPGGCTAGGQNIWNTRWSHQTLTAVVLERCELDLMVIDSSDSQLLSRSKSFGPISSKSQVFSSSQVTRGESKLVYVVKSDTYSCWQLFHHHLMRFQSETSPWLKLQGSYYSTHRSVFFRKRLRDLIRHPWLKNFNLSAAKKNPRNSGRRECHGLAVCCQTAGRYESFTHQSTSVQVHPG